MTFVDTNVLIDIVTRDAGWFDWSAGHLSAALAEGDVLTSAVVTAEMTRGFATCADLIATLDRMSVRSIPLDAEPAFLAGKAFASYRSKRDRGEHLRVLPDFFIGAHAAALGMPLLTRDRTLYRRYFPDLPLITPETDA